MATKSSDRSFLSGDQSAAKIRRDYIEKPLAAAKLSIIGTGLELFNFMSVLPDAFIASQQRELERVMASSDKNDARVANLEASIQQATTLRTAIQCGEARVNRALGSFGDRENAFHGFVSNGNLEPIQGLTVRLSVREGKRGLSATTDDDGYFRIPLGSKSQTGKEWREQVGEIRFTEKLKMFEERVAATVSSKPDSDANAAGSQNVAQAEILQAESLLYTDPSGVPTSEGSVYREYVLTNVNRNEGYYQAEEMAIDKVSPAKRASRKKSTKK